MPGKQYLYTDGLQTARLTTRWLQAQDAALWSGFFDYTQRIRFLPDFGFDTTIEKAQHMIGFQLKRYSEQRYGLQALIHRQTGEFVGLCGLLLQEIDGVKELEIGYHLLKTCEGCGYATEAAQAFKDYARLNNLADSVVSVVDVENHRSARVAQRNGMHAERETTLDGDRVVIYRLLFT